MIERDKQRDKQEKKRSREEKKQKMSPERTAQAAPEAKSATDPKSVKEKEYIQRIDEKTQKH